MFITLKVTHPSIYGRHICSVATTGKAETFATCVYGGSNPNAHDSLHHKMLKKIAEKTPELRGVFRENSNIEAREDLKRAMFDSFVSILVKNLDNGTPPKQTNSIPDYFYTIHEHVTLSAETASLNDLHKEKEAYRDAPVRQFSVFAGESGWHASFYVHEKDSEVLETAIQRSIQDMSNSFDLDSILKPDEPKQG